MAAHRSKLADSAVFVIVLYFRSFSVTVCVCVSVFVHTISTDRVYFISHMYVKQTDLFLTVVIYVLLEMSHWGVSF